MESVAQSIVSKVGQVLAEEFKEIRGVGDKVRHLRDELATMNAVLRVISEAEQDSVDHVVREWEKQVHDLIYDAENCTDTYSLRIVRPIPPFTRDDVRGRRVTFWARNMFARAKHIVRYRYEKVVLQRTLAADINALLARATIVSERRARYGINRVALPRSACLGPVSVASFSMSALRRAHDTYQFVGEQANNLAKKIRASLHDEDHKRLKVFSIVGFGGLGKTTLATELCRKLDVDFPYQARVSVSQVFDVEKDMKGLLVRVHQQILNEKVDAKAKRTTKGEGAVGQIDKLNVEELSSKIKDLLHHKR
ncbi:hypothetical protein CFC21_094888 [Triticum aestivum]|uniref:Rx N-terminal domain-containing protein n=2 Tax=Triticum aestivum TaxID=4565 RepID=A0A9R1MWZ5_WHEAT|nr:hypothetical protein CFC21_094888 [Triticum aestivum]